MLDTLVARRRRGRGRSSAGDRRGRATRSTDAALDRAFVAEAVLLPSESFIGDQMAMVDPEAIFRAREALRRDLGTRARGASGARPMTRAARQPLRIFARGQGRAAAAQRSRSAISPRAARRMPPTLAFAQFEAADNMTDRQGALTTLVNGDVGRARSPRSTSSTTAIATMRWCSTNGSRRRRCRRATIRRAVVAELARHPDFTLANPNRARVAGRRVRRQPARVPRRAAGAGYRFLADQLIALDKLNPQTAAKLLPPLGRWRRFDAARAALMRAELERIVRRRGLSKDMFEQASKSLDG